MKTWILLGLLVATAFACDSSSPGDDPDAGAAADGVPPSEVRFQRDVVPVLNRSCGTMTGGCHSRAMYGANAQMDCRGWLSLENAAIGSVFYGGASEGQPTGCPDRTLYQRLLEIAPWQCAATTSYAVPGDLANSYLVDKVMGTNLCDIDGGAMLSQQMPPSDSMFVLTPGDRDTIRAWVQAGARDD